MGGVEQAVAALNRAYLRQHPVQAAGAAGRLKLEELVEWLEQLGPAEAIGLWEQLPVDRAAESLDTLSPPRVTHVLGHADAVGAARVLARLPAERRQRYLAGLADTRARELSSLVQYPEDSAGALMDPHFLGLQPDMTVRTALQRLRRSGHRYRRQLFAVDGAGRLQHMLELQDLALAEPGQRLSELARSVPAAVLPTASREEVVEELERHKLTDLPVIDIDGRLLGVIRHGALVSAVREESSADIVSMVGASRDERALSNVSYVVRKRLPWLHVNLVTAFLAAAVVGLFESTIAQFTALAVLLPVVAGQSGNTGAQALAVTMRGLALREIGTSHWRRVARKEVAAGFFNGLAIAVVTAAGVWVWSGSEGLALVIGVSMVLSMVAAGLSGVVIPIVLSGLGQDPAQSSSIILTTVTDVVGFFTFLGIATLLAGML